jgi:penicillin-binding protein 1C
MNRLIAVAKWVARLRPRLRLMHVRIAVATLLAPWVAIAIVACFLPLPVALKKDVKYTESTRYLDREGRLLREVRADDAARAQWLSLNEAGPNVRKAVVAAEDSRFYDHPGVDPIAVARAAAGDLAARRITSGASTLTMQLARVVEPHPRTLRGKLYEMALAMRIEGSLSKDEVLEQYINRAPFGVGIRGVAAASVKYFDKPASDLSLAEAATLAAIPRGPAVYSIEKHPDRVLRRRNRVLQRMADQGFITEAERKEAEAEPLTPQTFKGTSGAPHLVVALDRGALDDADARVAQRASSVTTTIDHDLQRESEIAVQEALRPLGKKHVTQASVVVIDNATGEIRAYVGSNGFDDPNGGQNDGVRAKRQPGSTLKPFVYGMLMERRGATPATVLPDIELHLADGEGTYAPNNYDGRFHGPVRMREALGNSYNVPAVVAADQVGTGPIVERLRSLGMTTLSEPSEHYGDAIALGDGEVRLLDLTNAYATLARGGVNKPVRAVKHAALHGGETFLANGGPADEERVMPRWEADLVTDMLKDRTARIASFGETSVLDFPFEVAAKTGTSKGFRDNWTVGYTTAVTVGVWVGNFDGSPMHGSSGITGAGPIFQAVMSAAMRGRDASSFHHDDSLVEVDVCPLSGKRAGKHCHHHVRELVPRGTEIEECEMHVEVAVDTRNGLRATPDCDARFVARRELVRLPPEYGAWAKSAGIAVAPEEWSPLCGGRAVASSSAPRIRFPSDGAHFAVDPGRPIASQMLPISVDAAGGGGDVRILVDGRPLAEAGQRAFWRMEKGEHEIAVESRTGARSDVVRVRVD